MPRIAPIPFDQLSPQSRQIVEAGTAAGLYRLHRFIHTLDVYGDSLPVIDYSPEQVDSAR